MQNLMRCFLNASLVVSVVVFAAGSANAAKKEKKQDDGSSRPVFAIPKEITLTSDQQTKLDDIKKEWGPKVVEAEKKLDAILTDDQKTAKKDAIAKAKADGKKGKERTTLINDALKLSGEQKSKTKDAEAEIAKQNLSIKEQIYALLTDEQKPSYKLPKAKKQKAA